MDAVFTGVLDIYYAEQTAADTTTTAATYDTPKILGETIEVKLTANYAESKLDASNKRIKQGKKLMTYGVSLNTANIAPDVIAELMGRTEDTNGVQTVGTDQVAPTVAIGFAVTYDDGGKELWWLPKVNFAELNKEAKTESADGIEYHTPTIEGTALPLKNDGTLAKIIDSNNDSASSTVIAGWFSAVYLGPTTPPEPEPGEGQGG